MRSSLLLLVCLTLALMAAGEADAKEPKWSYATEDRVKSVAISADGEYIVAGSEDKKVYLFDKDSSTPLWYYETGSHVYSVDISADGEYIVAGSLDGKVYLFDKDSSTPLWSYHTGNGVDTVAISADGEYIAAGSRNSKVYLFDKDSSTPLWNYATDDGNVHSVAISADGEYIAAGCSKVYLFGKDSSTPLWSYATEDLVSSVAISADGEYIVAGSQNSVVYLFDKDSSTPLWSYATEDQVYSVAISADGEYIAAGSGNSKVYLFGKDSSTPLWSYTTGSIVLSVAISADGEYIAVGSYDDKFYLFDKDSSTPLWSYHIGGWSNSVAISADGDYIAAGSEDEKVYLFSNNVVPTATIDSITPSPARFDAEVTFSGTGSDSDGTVVTYEWTSSIDGFLSDEEDFSTTGFSVGTHNLWFRVQDNDGEWSDVFSFNTAELVIYPNNPPVANIDSIAPSSARFKNEVVTFNGSGSDSDGTIVAYKWTSDIDGVLSDEEDFSSTGFSVGTHTISLQVEDNDGEWSDWDTAELVIYPNNPPVANIDLIAPSPAEKGVEATFNGTGVDSDGTVVAYHWESSIDGELRIEANFSSNSLSLGHHTITFLVQDNDGGWGDAVSESLFVFAYPVAIAGQDSTGTPGVPLQFSGAGTDEDGTIAKYEWDFDGDGVFEWSFTENGLNTYIYNNENTYTAVLRVTDNDGFTDTDTVEITISEKKIQIDDEGNVTVTDAEEDEEGIPTLSVITTMAAVAVMALRRRPE